NATGLSVALTSSQNPSSFGQAVAFTAQVSATISGSSKPTGTVTFVDGAASLGTVTLSSGQAQYTTSTLTAGSHSITAAYSGDSNYSPHQYRVGAGCER